MKNILISVCVLSIFLPSFVFASLDVSLKVGSSGSAVLELQNFLQTEGFLKGKIDGKFGLLTKNAVKAFQLANGLFVDGSFGKLSRTKASLILSQSQSSNNVNNKQTIAETSNAVNSPVVVPFNGTLDLAINSSFVSQSITAPQSKFKLADFSLKNNTTEAINLNKIEVDLAIGSDPYIVNLYLSNLYVVYGNNTTFLNSVKGDNYWPIDSKLPVGQTINLSIFADINSFIPLNSVINSSLLVSGVSVDSATNVYTNFNKVLSGQNITISAGSLSVSQDSTTPASKIYVYNQKIVAGKFKFTSVADSYNISDLKFIIPVLNNSYFISDVTMSDSDTGTLIATMPIKYIFGNDYSSIEFTNINIPVLINSSKSIIINYNLNKNIDSNSAGLNIAPVLVYVKARNINKDIWLDGYASSYDDFASSYGGISLPSSGITVNSLQIFKSIPTLENIPLSNVDISNDSNIELYKFKIKADSSGDVSFKQLLFSISLNDSKKNFPRLTNFSLLKGNSDYTGSVAIGDVTNKNFIGLTSIYGIGSGVTNTIAVNFAQEEVIPAGTYQTYTLKAYTKNFVSSNSVSTYIPADSEKLNGGSHLNTTSSKFYHGLSQSKIDTFIINYYNLLWSDMSEPSTNIHNNFNGSYTNDWYNGVGILNLPLVSQMINMK